MATYLVTLSLGPVQSLIEAARRTRDLWCGSWLLSEAAKAAALSLHKAHAGCLVFPCPENPENDLAPADKPGEMANVSNIIRARIEDADATRIAVICGKAKKAAADRVLDLCEKARNKVSSLPFHEELWEQQINDILESYSAWTVLREGETYGQASKRLGGLLAARKATRDFLPAAEDPSGLGYGVPKSSLDAARESVLKVPRKEREEARYRTPFRKLGLAGREELDALALAKRLAGEAEQFTAYSRVAADAWINTLTDDQRQAIAAVYEQLIPPGHDLATRVKGNRDTYQAFPYDAQMLYGFRLANALMRADLSADERERLSELEHTLRSIAGQANRFGAPVGAPVPYAVILKADGDRMGKLLSSAKSDEESREISKALQAFADAVPETVREHRGHAIYSGGDDVLALLPLENAVEAADALRAGFRDVLKPVAKRLDLRPDDYPTLSVGLGIGHIMEPLGTMRARADAAEKDAKGDDLEDDRAQRNALAIRLGIRSGAERRWRGQWEPPTPLNDLRTYKRSYRSGELPSRVAYDLSTIAKRLEWLEEWIKPNGSKDEERVEMAKGMQAAEVKRMLERARIEGGETIPRNLQDLLVERAREGSLTSLADALIIARWLGARTAEDVGDRGNG